MSTIGGSADDPRQPWGVLGTGTPLDFPTQDGPVVVPAVGVQGVAADSQDSVDVFTQGFGDEPVVQPGAGAGVLGVRLAPVSNGAPIESFGFLAGHSPFAGETTGAFGQAAERGVIGIATTADGVGVYGGSLGGIATGVVGDTEGGIGVHGRAAASGLGLRGENTAGGIAGQFHGKVEILGDTTVAGTIHVDHIGLQTAVVGEIDLETKLNQVTTYCMRQEITASRIFTVGFSVDDAPPFAITNDSIVMVSLTELADGVPHMGAITMKVYNVVATGSTNPETNLCSGTVTVRGEVDSDTALRIRVSILIANPAIAL
jgi:hypothetical protein